MKLLGVVAFCSLIAQICATYNYVVLVKKELYGGKSSPTSIDIELYHYDTWSHYYTTFNTTTAGVFTKEVAAVTESGTGITFPAAKFKFDKYAPVSVTIGNTVYRSDSGKEWKIPQDKVYNVPSGGIPDPTHPLTSPKNCRKGVSGKKYGRGVTGDCCSTSDDCKDSCIKGKCGHYNRK